MLTLVTKYSRIPTDSLKLKRYNAVMETGAEPVMIEPTGCMILRDALDKKAAAFEIHILNLAILPDHIHVNIDMGETKHPLKKIITQLKGYSSYAYNHLMQNTTTGKGRQQNLRAEGRSETYLKTQNHLNRAIEYVQNNHAKHTPRRGEEYLKQYMSERDIYTSSIDRKLSRNPTL